jgi:hypothetical protein
MIAEVSGWLFNLLLLGMQAAVTLNISCPASYGAVWYLDSFKLFWM